VQGARQALDAARSALKALKATEKKRQQKVLLPAVVALLVRTRYKNREKVPSHFEKYVGETCQDVLLLRAFY